MSLLELDSINSGYGHFQALFDVNLHLEEGETHAIIGANGGGKSTLLRSIAGLQKLDDGTVSTEYGTIGKGMHAGLPGHSFVLIDKTGKQRWYGEYPSMWLSNADLLKEVHSHLVN